MEKNISVMRIGLIFSLVLAFCSKDLIAQSPQLNSVDMHQFDFWLGEWNVYKYGTDSLVGHSHITSIIDSVGIQEFYRSTTSAYHGTSLNKYNFKLKKWQQFWVDNAGLSLQLSGNVVDGNMVMLDASTSVGSPMNKITWANNEDGTVRQTWVQSSDGGLTWKTIFDGHYTKK